MLNKYHPFTLFLYFSSVLGFTMFIQNPIFMIIALLCGLLFYMSCVNYKIDSKSLIWNLILFVLISVTNPIFVHMGVSKLFYLGNNAVTLEALLYGVNIGIMILAVIYWFKCLNMVLNQEKILYLFSRISPKLALLISNSLRFIPMLKEQAQRVRNAQTVMGIYTDDDYLNRLKSSLRVYSSVTTYGLEKAIEIGSSMEARGYNLKGRTYYSDYKIKSHDIVLILACIIFDCTIITAKVNNKINFDFYPNIEYSNIDIVSLIAIIAFFILAIIPFIINLKEGLKWKYLKSKI